METKPAERPLTPPEAFRFKILKGDVAKWLQQTPEAIAALMEIRDKRYYRAEFNTFEEFCQKYCGWTRRRVDQIIKGAAEVKELPKSVAAQVEKMSSTPSQPSQPSNEGSGSSDGEGGEGGNGDGGGEPDPPKPDIELDSVGYPIPKGCLDVWERKDEAQKFLTSLSKLKSVVVTAREEKDPLFLSVSLQIVEDHLARSYQFMTEAKPYAVCSACQGVDQIKDGCRLCKGVGLLSKFGFENKAKNLAKFRKGAA